MVNLKKLYITIVIILVFMICTLYLSISDSTGTEQHCNTIGYPSYNYCQLKHFRQLLKGFLSDLESTRRGMLMYNGVINATLLATNATQKLFAFQFRNITYLPNIITVNVKQDVTTVWPALDYYPRLHVNYTSNVTLSVGSVIPYHADNPFVKNYAEQLKSRSTMDVGFFKRGLDMNYHDNKTHMTLTFVHVIRGGIILPEGQVKVDRAIIHPGGCGRNRFEAKKQNDHNLREVFSIAQYWGYGYFHAFVEDMPRIAPFLDFLHKEETIRIHVMEINSFTVDLLNQLGIAKDRLVSGQIQADIIYMPQNSNCGNPFFFSLHLLSLHLRPSIHRRSCQFQGTSNKYNIILIKRSTKRYFRKHNEILKELQKVSIDYSATITVFDDRHLPTFDETIKLFNEAAMVIAPHGAGLSNVIFSEPGTVVIEVLCSEAKSGYGGLSKMMGHIYYGVYPMFNCRDTSPAVIMRPVKQYLEILRNKKVK